MVRVVLLAYKALLLLPPFLALFDLPTNHALFLLPTLLALFSPPTLAQSATGNDTDAVSPTTNPGTMGLWPPELLPPRYRA